MTDYSFIIKFIISPHQRFDIESKVYKFNLDSINMNVELLSKNLKTSIRKSTEFILKSSGWESEEKARQSGYAFLQAFKISLSLQGIGHDYGVRVFRTKDTSKQYKYISKGLALQAPTEDIHGVMVMETIDFSNIPRSGKQDVLIFSDIEEMKNIEKNIDYIIENNYSITENQIISIEAYNSSFFQENSDIRFLLRIMSLEALIDQERRSQNARKHIDEIIKLTQKSNLDEKEKQSLVSSIGQLKKKSISQSGAELASKYLREKKYMNLSASDFFKKCYAVRSKLIHKDKDLPTITEVSRLSEELEIFVREMLYQSIVSINQAS